MVVRDDAMSKAKWGWLWKVIATILGPIAIGAVAEAWHASWGPCGALKSTILRVCTHPLGFLVLDFVILASAAFLVLVSLLIVQELLRRIWRRKDRRGYPIASEPQIIALGLVVASVAFAASFLAPSLRQSTATPRPLYGLLPSDISNVVWGIRLVVSVTVAPVLAVFAVLLVLGFLSSKSTHPLMTAAGVFLGAASGFLSPIGRLADPLLVSLLEPLLGRHNSSFYGIFLLAPVFGYSSFILGSLAQGRAFIPAKELALSVAAGSALFIPLAVSFDVFSLLLLLLYILVLTVVMTRFVLSHHAASEAV